MHGPVLDGAQQSDCTAVSRRYSQCSTAEGWAHVQHGPGGLCMGWELLSQWGQVAGTARTWWLGHETDACLLFDPENKLQLQCSLWGTNISLASLVNLLSLRVHTWWNYLSCNEYQFKLLMLTSACPNAWLFPVSKSISLQHQGPKCSQPGSRVLAPPPPQKRKQNWHYLFCDRASRPQSKMTQDNRWMQVHGGNRRQNIYSFSKHQPRCTSCSGIKYFVGSTV